ncbi:TPR-like protein [Chaetoceros tenuissimus]|uniref:TPR-like protein n=1 Tax=Chaetoceros tenuissimus TaxID=426638 RepID=A0AAD3CZR0_9STRA|nr:TPR-like protein [Chaetoceros tenuissimus]
MDTITSKLKNMFPCCACCKASQQKRTEKESDNSCHNTEVDVEETIPFPKNGIKLSYLLNEFVEECGGRKALKGKTTTDVNEDFVKPFTKDYEQSYCDMILEKAKDNDDLNGVVTTATVFISHAWKYKFLHVLDALKDHFKDEPDKIVWFDIVSNNQHKATELEYGWWATTFKDAIEKFGHTVMVMAPWNNPIPYKRAWCIFEAYCTNITGAKFEIAMSSKEQKDFIMQCKYEGTRPIHKMLSDVDAEKSEAFKLKDKERIHSVIREKIGFTGINSMLFEQLRDWVINVGLKELEISEVDSEEHLSLMNMHETKLGPDHPRTLTSMNNLALLYYHQGKYDLAEPLYKDCLSKYETKLGPDHPDTLRFFNNLAILYYVQGKYDLAEPLYKDCLSKNKTKLGPDHPDTLLSVNNLAGLYRDQGKYDLAEPLYKDCLSKRETKLGPDHPDTLQSINDLAALYNDQGKYELAEPLYKDFLSKQKTKLGPDHPDTLNSMNGLAYLYYKQGNYDFAEPLYKDCSSKK